ncbi:Hypothetical predicted protein [Mytilus galloprovincialis]|uniref:Uncharacterized protein n=1 Tax=Mytilus galloprovincialis TaxID=29158 RepID=A0A8B6FX80_MYTGA|nr:Hypothetical predicted protein [Mytilus galloprovincialis]
MHVYNTSQDNVEYSLYSTIPADHVFVDPNHTHPSILKQNSTNLQQDTTYLEPEHYILLTPDNVYLEPDQTYFQPISGNSMTSTTRSRAADDHNTEVGNLRQQIIREFSKPVKTQKERKSDKNSPQPPAAASSELFEMKDQMQTVTAILSDMNVQNIPQDTNDRQYRLDGNTNYPANS